MEEEADDKEVEGVVAVAEASIRSTRGGKAYREMRTFVGPNTLTDVLMGMASSSVAAAAAEAAAEEEEEEEEEEDGCVALGRAVCVGMPVRTTPGAMATEEDRNEEDVVV